MVVKSMNPHQDYTMQHVRFLYMIIFKQTDACNYTFSLNITKRGHDQYPAIDQVLTNRNTPFHFHDTNWRRRH